MEDITTLNFHSFKTLDSILTGSSTTEPRVTESFTMELSSDTSMDIYKNNLFSSFTAAMLAGVILDGSLEVAPPWFLIFLAH